MNSMNILVQGGSFFSISSEMAEEQTVEVRLFAANPENQSEQMNLWWITASREKPHSLFIGG